MTVFLVITSLTGTLLAFNTELERLLAAVLVPQARVRRVMYVENDQARVLFAALIDPEKNRRYDLGFTEFFVGPWTGNELGRRKWGDLSQGRINLMPFIYTLHFALAIGKTGEWILGITALFWTFDCFIGFYLTLPVSKKDFWRDWKTTWSVKSGTSFTRLNFDIHRASGLWLWPMLLVFA